MTEMFFRIRAENFGPLLEKVFHRVGDDGRGTEMSALSPHTLSCRAKLAL
jgi:hypothetical protein